MAPAVSPRPPLQRLPQGTVERWPVRCEACPREYARLCWGNLWRTLLTAGLYWPWARVRSQRYLLRRTRVAHAKLDYHEPAPQLLRRQAWSVLLVAGVGTAWAGSAMAGLWALSLALAVWPLLVFMGLRQRLSHLSWAKRRLAFDGLCEDTYRALWAPLASAGAVAWVLMAAVLWQRPAVWLSAGLLLGVWALATPVFLWTWFRFRQHQLRLGPLGMVWRAQRSAMLVLCLRTLVWAMLSAVFTLGLAAVGAAVRLSQSGHLGEAVRSGLAWAVLVGVAMAVWPFAQARLQNLVWSKTGNRYLRFRSRLPVRAYVALQYRHALWLVLTLGLYWPWAVVANRRMRTHALTVWARIDPQVLQAHWPPHQDALAAKIAGSPERTRRTI